MPWVMYAMGYVCHGLCMPWVVYVMGYVCHGLCMSLKFGHSVSYVIRVKSRERKF